MIRVPCRTKAGDMMVVLKRALSVCGSYDVRWVTHGCELAQQQKEKNTLARVDAFSNFHFIKYRLSKDICPMKPAVEM